MAEPEKKEDVTPEPVISADDLHGMLSQINDTLTSMQPKPAPAQPEGLDAIPLDRLKSMRGQVPDEQKDTFDEYVANRQIDEEIDRRFGAFRREETFKARRKEATEQAYKQYPELKDKKSEFYKTIEDRLQGRKDELLSNPTLTLDIANAVAIETGYHVKKTVTPTPEPPKKRGKPVNADTPDDELVTDEEVDKLASRFQSALPTGKEFDKARIKKRMAEYKRVNTLL